MTISWVTPVGSLGTLQERVPNDTQLPIRASSTVGPVTFTLLAGKLPRGMRLDSAVTINGAESVCYLKGSPVEVSKVTVSRFVIRADDGTDIEDRTFSLTVDGSDEPVWITQEGFLPIGTNDTYFVLDNAYVDYQLEADDPDLNAGDILTFYVPPGGGELPPGLTLTSTGRILGYTDPIFAVEYNLINGGYDTASFDILPLDITDTDTNGYDTFLYDVETFDYNEPSIAPKRLSRFYSFVVAVSDGVNEIRRAFRIYVVSEDFLKADNTLVHVDTNLFKADSSSNRKPLWITNSDLGRRRANNYLTIFLDVYDPPSLSGNISYFLLPTNRELKTTSLRINSDENVTGEMFMSVATNTRPTIGHYAELAKNYLIKDVVLTDTINGVNVYRLELTTALEEVVTEGRTVYIGTASEIPPGMVLDTTTGEIAGKVPYQARLSKTYSFTMQAVNFSTSISDIDYELVGDWNFSTIYTVNQAVRYLGFVYKCLKSNSGKVPEDGTYWSLGVSSSDKTFTIDIIGEIESAIEWITTPGSSIGSIKPNQPSSLYVEASSLLYGGRVSYELVSGELPPGLSLLSTGKIQGKVKQFGDAVGPGVTRFYERDSSTEDSSGTLNYTSIWDSGSSTFDRVFTFQVIARDGANFAESTETFSITVLPDATKNYANLYIKAFQPKSKRLEWFDFITDSTIFNSSNIYRYGDPNFGVQPELKVLLFAGIESVDAVSYVQAMSRNHYNKKLKFGDVKIAKAKDPTTQATVYEVVYLDVIDEYEKDNVSISDTVQLPNKIESKVLISYDKISVDSDIPFVSDSDHQRVFPNSIKNMRKRIKNVGARNREYLPLWMRSIQDVAAYETGYVKAVILCYALPGKGDTIVSKIRAKTYAASRGNWISNTSYQLDDTVKYKGSYYTCLANNTGKNPETESFYWVKNFDFKQIDFEADRYIIDILDGEIKDKYLAFPQTGEKE